MTTPSSKRPHATIALEHQTAQQRRRKRYNIPSLKSLCLEILAAHIELVSLDYVPTEYIPILFRRCFYRHEHGSGAWWWSKIRPFLSPGLLDDLDISWIEETDLDEHSFGIFLEWVINTCLMDIKLRLGMR